MIAVPTPLGPDNSPDITYVDAAAGAIASTILSDACVIVQSTLLVGVTDRAAQTIADLRPDLVVPRDGGDDSADIAIGYWYPFGEGRVGAPTRA